MPKYTVKDTITFERTWEIWARTEEQAIEIADSGSVDALSEEQIDNTPYEAEVAP